MILHNNRLIRRALTSRSPSSKVQTPPHVQPYSGGPDVNTRNLECGRELIRTVVCSSKFSSFAAPVAHHLRGVSRDCHDVVEHDRTRTRHDGLRAVQRVRRDGREVGNQRATQWQRAVVTRSSRSQVRWPKRGRRSSHSSRDCRRIRALARPSDASCSRFVVQRAACCVQADVHESPCGDPCSRYERRK